jgi:hypothetical protein
LSAAGDRGNPDPPAGRSPVADCTPKPIWLWCSVTGAPPADVDRLWQAFLRRFDLEHTFRLYGQVLGWTAPKLRDPAAADRWTWLLITASVQLRLAHPLAADLRPGNGPPRRAGGPRPGSAAGSGTSTRPCPAWPVRRNPANPAPAGRQGRETSARHPATTWGKRRRGMPRSRHDVNAQVKRQAQRTDHLRAALLNRDVIGQAKGIIMERYNIDADAAFGTLKRISQDQNMKLHEVARNDAAIIKLNVRGQQAAGPPIVRAATSHARATRRIEDMVRDLQLTEAALRGAIDEAARDLLAEATAKAGREAPRRWDARVVDLPDQLRLSPWRPEARCPPGSPPSSATACSPPSRTASWWAAGRSWAAVVRSR